MPGRELDGIHFAMDFLTQQNKRVAGDDEARAAPKGTLTAKGKHVIVIGGGDTGSDCIGTSNRQGAASVTQLEIMPQPPEKENKALTWPDWPLKLRTSSSHEEGVERDFAVLTKRAVGADGKVEALECVRVDGPWARRAPHEGGRRAAPSSSRPTWSCWPWASSGRAQPGMVEQAGVALDPRGNVAANVRDYQTLRRRSCSPPATCGAASRWWSGRSARAASAPGPSTKV